MQLLVALTASTSLLFLLSLLGTAHVNDALRHEPPSSRLLLDAQPPLTARLHGTWSPRHRLSAQLPAPVPAPLLQAVENNPANSTVLQHVFQALGTALGEDPAARLPAVPTTAFSVAFAGKPMPTGAFVPMSKAEDPPVVAVTGKGVYTWLLIDIDAPDPKAPTHAPYLHAIVSGLTRSSTSSQTREEEEEVAYAPVTPPVGSHRYVSLLFQQLQAKATGGTRRIGAPFQQSRRASFDVAAYARRHELHLVASHYFVSAARTDSGDSVR